MEDPAKAKPARDLLCECLNERRGIEEREDIDPQAYCSDYPMCGGDEDEE